MTYAKRSDANQQDIIDALRAIGASVVSIHRVGGGVPDLLVGYQGVNLLLEVKTARGRLNRCEAEWHQEWRGQVAVVRTVDEAIEIVTGEGER
jgi:Holliday junction resolvase